VAVTLSTVLNQSCYSINGISKAPFAYYMLNLTNQSLPLANTCLYGNGNIAASMLNTGLLSGILSGLPLSTFNPLVSYALGQNCGFP